MIEKHHRHNRGVFLLNKYTKERDEILIYNKIKSEAAKKGMSICALEKAAGIGNGVIAGWKNSSPTLDKLKKVAGVLEVSIDYLTKDDAG